MDGIGICKKLERLLQRASITNSNKPIIRTRRLETSKYFRESLGTIVTMPSTDSELTARSLLYGSKVVADPVRRNQL